jgi:hypothetical protein
MKITKALVAAAATVAGALLTAGAAQADDVIVGDNGVPYTYTTQRACLSDGPDTHLEQNDSFYAYYYCTQGDDGRWLLHNTDQPGG